MPRYDIQHLKCLMHSCQPWLFLIKLYLTAPIVTLLTAGTRHKNIQSTCLVPTCLKGVGENELCNGRHCTIFFYNVEYRLPSLQFCTLVFATSYITVKQFLNSSPCGIFFQERLLLVWPALLVHQMNSAKNARNTSRLTCRQLYSARYIQ